MTYNVASDRLLEIFELITTYEREHPRDASLCMVSADVVGMDGAGILLLTDEVLTPWCANNGTARDLMDIEVVFHEGPGNDAARSGYLSAHNDLVENSEWTFYAPEAIKLGVRAVCAFPVYVGFHKLGALILNAEQPRPLSDAQLSDGYLMASVIGRDVLATVFDAPHDSSTGEVGGPSNFDFVLHQATGMVSVQAGLPVHDAVVTIRSHAFAIGVSPGALASRIVNREIRYDKESSDWKSE